MRKGAVRRPGVYLLALDLLLALNLAIATLSAAQTFPPPPGPRDFILDQAGLIDAQDSQQIRSLSDRLLSETQIPLVVVTIPSLVRYGGASIESYARGLFDHWGIGSQARNYGILLLVSVGDRKARIELGAAWAGTKDDTAQMIMQDIIVPNFKNGQFSMAILQGVQALDTMARGHVVRAPGFWWMPLVFFGAIGLGVAAAISLIRSGQAGWGWALLGVLFTILLGVLFIALKVAAGAAERESGSGSFAGGSGGGGGATGSW